MTVQQLIDKLSKFDPNAEVNITNRFNYDFYWGDFEVVMVDGEVDISVGGFRDERNEE